MSARAKVEAHHELTVRAFAGARSNAICGQREGDLVVRVSAPPEHGKANAAICKLLADRLGLARSAVWIARGQASSRKTVAVQGIDAATLQERLRISLPGGAGKGGAQPDPRAGC